MSYSEDGHFPIEVLFGDGEWKVGLALTGSIRSTKSSPFLASDERGAAEED
jgi:hypothetical protein